MRLLKIELCDVGPFSRYSADLSGNVVYIGGSNGTGKSTILSAIQYAATGDLSRLGDREAYRIDRTGKDRPYVRLTFDPLGDGEVAVVTRWLPVDNKAATRKLLYKDKAYTAKSDIEDRLARWTGLSAKALSDYVFVEQGCLTDVVSDQTGRRAEVLQKLFGVAEAETGRAALLEHLARLPQPADPEILATVRQQAADAEHQLRSAEIELSSLPQLDAGREESDRKLLISAKRAKDLSIAAESARARVRESEAVLAAAAPQAVDVDLVRQAENAVVQWRAYRDAEKRYADELDRYHTAEKAYLAEKANLDDHPPPGEEPQPPAVLVQLRAAKFAAEIVAGMSGNDCPICGSRLATAVAEKEEATRRLEELAAAEAEYADALRSWRWRLADHNDHKARTANAKMAVDTLRAVIGPAPTAPETDEVAARQLVEIAARVDVARAADAQRRATAESTIRSAKVIILSADSQNVPSDAAVDAAEKRQSAAADLRTRRASAEAKLAAARRAYESSSAALEKAESLGKAHAETAAWRKVVEGAAAILRKEAAPAETIKACLADLSADLNTRLGHLGASFRVIVNEDGGLSADMGGSRILSARRLSGGQKVVLSLAWRLAVLDRYAPKAGLLCLDEPTNHLDEARVAALKDAIDAWRPHGADRQFIIVTHARKLAAACDKVIQLGNA